MSRRKSRPGRPLALALALALVTGSTLIAAGGASASTLSARLEARAVAETHLAAVRAPAGARAVAALRSVRLRTPAQSLACTPLVDATRRWVVAGTTMRAVADDLAAHPSPGMSENGTGRAYHEPKAGHPIPPSPAEVGRTESRDVTEVSSGTGLRRVTLVYTIAPVRSGSIGVRADIQAVPRGADCISAG